MGKCLRPVRVKTKTGKEFFRRCNSPVFSYCKSCAALNARDYKEVLARGITDDYYYISAVLTAPSFGKTHKEKRCKCEAGGHDPKDKILHTNVYEQYNFDGQMRWNYQFNRLLSYTLSKINRSVKLDGQVIGREWQKRGVLHAHILFRVKTPEEVEKVVKRLEVVHKYRFHGFRWGPDCYYEVLPDADAALRVGKYGLKGLGFNTRFALSNGREDFVKELDKAVDRVGEDWTDNQKAGFGWSGKPITFSLGWALDGSTIKKLRQERAEWGKKQFEKNGERVSVEGAPAFLVDSKSLREAWLSDLLDYYNVK